MTERAKRIMEAYEAQDTYNYPQDGVAAAIREVVIGVVLSYMQYAEWEIVNKIMEDINELADELENLK